MNFISCDRDCDHQKDGCCALKEAAALTGDGDCGYYKSRSEIYAPASYEYKKLSENFKGLR